ncbi:DUF4355 domain-containing protein [Bacillus sp. JJ722]|uniref:DUF4355 domain-containing protein n=1 Tax=Bacillus sp. JJ722 TaxID=3122973 RepID=UPI003000F556
MKVKQPTKLVFFKEVPRLLSLNLQFFNDDPPNPDPDPTPPPNPEPPALTLESIQAFMNENEDGKKWLQSLTDTRVTDAIKTYETKTLPKKLEAEIAKRFPAETEEQKQLRELKQQFERLETEKQRETLKNKALSVATEKALPSKLVDYFIGQDEESTLKNLTTLEEVFSASVQKAVEQKFKEGGRDPKPPADPGTPLTKEAIDKMSPEEINKNWDQIQQFLKGQ